MQRQRRGSYLRADFFSAQLQRTFRRWNVYACRELLKREKIHGIVAPVDSRLHHSQQRPARECRHVVEVYVAQTKASYYGAALAVEFEIDFCIRPTGKLYASQIQRT